MKGIEFKNFRNFENLHTMDIDGISILVGPNNSGKSTITKACRLVAGQKYLYREINRDPKKHFPTLYLDFGEVCKTYKRAYKSGASMPMEFSIKSGYFTTTYILKDGEYNNHESLRPIKEIAVYDEIDDFTWKCCFEEGVVKVEYNGKLLANIIRENIHQELRNNKRIGAIYRMCEDSGCDLQNILDEYNIRKKGKATISNSNNGTVKEIKPLTREEYCRIKGEIEDRVLVYANQLENDRNNREVSLSLEWLKWHSETPFPLYEGDYVVLFENPIRLEMEPEFSYSSDLGLDVHHMNAEELVDHYVPYTLEDFGGCICADGTIKCSHFFSRLKKDYNYCLSNILYIPAIDIPTHSIFPLQESKDESTLLIKKLYEDSYRSDRISWINRRMVELGIGTKLILNNIDGEVVEVSVLDSRGNSFPISDLGRGSVRLIMLLIKIVLYVPKPFFWEDGGYSYSECRAKGYELGYTLYESDHNFPDAELRNNKITSNHPIVIIEEPEQNLHPAMQSKLSDLFLQIRHLGYDVLIETHSEYLVRRSQVLVANKNYSDKVELEKKNPFKVFYIPSGEVPYQMHYNTTGAFVERFGKGFFDEASESDMVIIRKEMENNKKSR